MSGWYRFQSQFYETASERNERLRRNRERRQLHAPAKSGADDGGSWAVHSSLPPDEQQNPPDEETIRRGER